MEDEMILFTVIVCAEKLYQVSLMRIAGISGSQAGQYIILMLEISRISGIESFNSDKLCVSLVRVKVSATG